MALTLTIDIGSTNMKAGLVNEKGQVLSSSSSPIQTISNEPGAATHDPEQLKNILIALCKKVLQDNYNDEVECMVASTYHFGLIMMGKNRKPVTAMTLLTDIRAQNTFPEFTAAYKDKNVYHKTGCPFLSQYVLPRLYYFFMKKREVLEQAHYFNDSKSFLYEWLTGEWITDISTAAASQFYNINQFEWDQDLLSPINLSKEQFPAALDGMKHLAPLRKEIAELIGLKKDVKVLLGGYDGIALGVGISGLESEVGIVNLGTTAMLRVPCLLPVFDKNENKRIQALAIEKDLFLNGGAINNAALPLDWMRNNLFDFDLTDPELLRISNEPPLMALPYLTGERDTKIGPYASGVFFGIRRNHSRSDFARSILEGVAYSLRYIYEALQENNIQIREIRMGGGGVNITAWPQIFANVFGVPVTLPPANEMSLIGNAIMAFTAGGKYKTFKEASQNMLGEIKKIEPDNESVTHHDKQYQFFRTLREELGPLYKKHNELRY